MTTAADPVENRYRLPRSVLPVRYDLHLEVDLEGARFDGTVVTEITVLEPTSTIVVNTAELVVHEAWVLDAAGQHIDAEIELHEEDERATYLLSCTLSPGAATVHMRYSGVLNDKLRGFYRTTFTDADGVARVAGSTQFEATHARRAFPCWDEPDLKATFTVTLDVPSGELAISNAKELGRDNLTNGKTRFRFAETMHMSTYLVAFVVGPFETTPSIDVRGIPLRVVYPRGAAPHLANYGLETGKFGLEYLADYYGIPYPGDKIDLVAVPDFAFGAMENLGCVTFREVLLLTDPATSTQPEQQRVADVVFHELAHMWFGDLVTMKWWNGLWLNEAFATFMEMKCTDAFRPAWQRWVDFGLSRTAAFDTDSLASTRPIEFEVISPEDAEGMFDILTYEKGAAVLRMIEQYIGEDAFRNGVRRYLVEHSYGNTETNDLWDAIEAETGQPVRAVADSWIFQGGYPLVSVALADGGQTLQLEQEPFRFGNETELPPTLWRIPVLVRIRRGGADENMRILLEERRATIDLGQPADAVLLVNAGGHGFYRVRYTAAMLTLLTACAQDHLAAIERYGLVDDTYASMLAGRTEAAEFLALAHGLADDDDLSVWQRLAGGLGALSRLLTNDDLARFEALVRGLVGPALDIAGWAPAEGESDRQGELRATLMTLLGNTGNDGRVHHWARTTYDAGQADPSAVDPALASAAVTMLATRGDEATYREFLAKSALSTSPQEQRRYLYSLADFRVDALIDETLDRCRRGDIRTQDGPYLIGRVLSNRRQGVRAWRFVAANWDELNERFPSNTIVRMIASIATFVDPGVAEEVRSFFAEHPVPQGAKSLAQHLEKLAVNVALAEREGPRLAASLR